MPVSTCIMPDCDAPTITYGLCSKHRYRAEVVGVIGWFAKGRPGAVEELERRWTERQNKRSPKPQGDDGGREIKVPFAGGEVTLGKVDPTPGDDGGPMVSEADAAPVDGFARAMIEADAAPSPETADDFPRVAQLQQVLGMPPSTTAGAVVRVVERLVQRERAQDVALCNLGAFVGLADGATPLAVSEAIIGRMGELSAEIDRLRARVEELADKAQMAEFGLVLTPEEIDARYADLVRARHYMARAQYGRAGIATKREVAGGN